MPFRMAHLFVGLIAHEGKEMDETKQLQPAIFWDRDGTLIEDRGHLADLDRAVFLPARFWVRGAFGWTSMA